MSKIALETSYVYLSENSSFNGWASVNNFERKLFLPQLEDRLDVFELTKSTSESCSVVYRGKLYVYGQGSTDFSVFIF